MDHVGEQWFRVSHHNVGIDMHVGEWDEFHLFGLLYRCALLSGLRWALRVQRHTTGETSSESTSSLRFIAMVVYGMGWVVKC